MVHQYVEDGVCWRSIDGMGLMLFDGMGLTGWVQIRIRHQGTKAPRSNKAKQILRDTNLLPPSSFLDPLTHSPRRLEPRNTPFEIPPVLSVSPTTPNYTLQSVCGQSSSCVIVPPRHLQGEPYLKTQILSVHKYMGYTTQETSAGSSWTTPDRQGRVEEEETVTTPTILVSDPVTCCGTTTVSMKEPSLSSRRGIHKTIDLPPLSTEVPPALSTAALMKRAYELDQVNTPSTPVEKLIPSNPSAPPPAPTHKKTRVRHPMKPVRCNSKLYDLFPLNGGNLSPLSPLAPHLMNTGLLASPIHLIDPSDVESLPSPVSERIVGSLEATPVSAITTIETL